MKKQIYILVIVVLIIIVIINYGTFEKAKYEALNKSISSIMYEVKTKLSSNIEANNFPIMFIAENNKISSNKIELNINSKIPDSGNLIAYTNTEYEIAFYYNGICAIKGMGDTKITYSKIKEEQYKLVLKCPDNYEIKDNVCTKTLD